MFRHVTLSAFALAVAAVPALGAEPLSGAYVEARTCQVYTGPCFANGEVGQTGKDAVMTWRIDRGEFAGADLAGQSVAVVVKASHTLGFYGLEDADTKKAIVVIDNEADDAAAEALKSFALKQTGISESDVVEVNRADIDLQLDAAELTANVKVGDMVTLETRKARKGDCICSNESAYYPPLTSLTGFVPGVTIEGEVAARSLGSRWSIPDSRTAYLGTFFVEEQDVKLVNAAL